MPDSDRTATAGVGANHLIMSVADKFSGQMYMESVNELS